MNMNDDAQDRIWALLGRGEAPAPSRRFEAGVWEKIQAARTRRAPWWAALVPQPVAIAALAGILIGFLAGSMPPDPRPRRMLTVLSAFDARPPASLASQLLVVRRDP